jgi:hypothetical protein
MVSRRIKLAVLCILFASLGCTLGQEITTLTPQIVTVVVTQIPATAVNASTQVPTATTQPININSEATAFSKGEVITVGTATPTTRRVFIYLVALDDNGKSGKKIGCNDSIVPIEREIPRTASPLTDTLKLLFSAKQQFYGQSGFYNALYQSNLRVEGISERNGVFRVNLLGELSLGGICDNPRAEAQIKETIMQFATVKQANVFLNGVALENYFSER